MGSAMILVILGVCMVSYSGPLVKGALIAGANPVTVAMLRMAFASLLLTPLLFIRGKGQEKPAYHELKKLTRRQWLWSLVASAALALHYLTWMTSLASTSTFASVALVCTQPLFVALVSAVVLKEYMPRSAWPGAILAVAGAIVIAVASLSGGAGGDLAGDMLALLGALMMALHWLFSRYARKSIDALPFSLLVYIQTALFLALLMPFFGGFQVTGKALLYILGLALGCTVLGHFLFQIALGKVSATVVAFAILGEPVGAMVFSYFMFGERPTNTVLIGGALVLLGLIMYTAASAKNENN